MRIDEMERLINCAVTDHHAARVRAFVLNPLDRAQLFYEIRHSLRFTDGPDDTAPLSVFGVEIRKSPWMPEGIAAVVDGKDQLVCVVRLGH